MYGQQSMPRSMSGNQLNAMMSHSGMVINSSQPHMVRNGQQNIMVSQATSGYPQTMINNGQPPSQMIAGQSHNMGGQTMMSASHMGVVTQGMVSNNSASAGHININQQMSQVQMSQQQVYMQQQQLGAHATFSSNAQARSPIVGSASGPQQCSGPPSTGGPPSNNPQTPLNAMSSLNPASQQTLNPATPQQAPSSVQSTTTQDNLPNSSVVPPDPTSLARNLLLKDLRHSLQDWSKTAAEVIRVPSSRQQDGSVSTHNPLSVNPQSSNPQSVNPQSVNPLSANPSSVKSLDEPKSVEMNDRKMLNPSESYINSFDSFLIICDQIESDFMVVQEAQKQCIRFDKMFASELKAVGDMANANYSQYAQGYVESTQRVRNAVKQTLNNLDLAMKRMASAGCKKSPIDIESMEI